MSFVRCVFLCFFFFKQKTAYEMRISDWSSDVCSSDLFDSVNCVCDTLIADARAYTHAFGLQIGLQRGAHFRVHFGEQAAAATDGNLYTKTGEHLAQLNADHPPTDDQQRSGKSIKRQCRLAGEVGYRTEERRGGNKS